jgi:hypothetical protein
MSAATDVQATIEELLEKAIYLRSLPTLYWEKPLRKICKIKEA